MFTSVGSSNDIPAPYQPTPLSALTLVVTAVVVPLPFAVIVGVAPNPAPRAKLTVSVGLYPVPPLLRVTLVIEWPTGEQSVSIVTLLPQMISASGVPMTMIPPPLAGIVG